MDAVRGLIWGRTSGGGPDGGGGRDFDGGGRGAGVVGRGGGLLALEEELMGGNSTLVGSVGGGRDVEAAGAGTALLHGSPRTSPPRSGGRECSEVGVEEN